MRKIGILQFIVKTEKEEISVHLGPGWFIENQDIKIEPKDKIEVKGSRITFENIRISFLCLPQIPRNFPQFPPTDVLE